MGLEKLLAFKANALIDGLLEQVNIPSKYVFANNTARDTYFSTNPTELVEGLLIAVGTGFQKYIDSTWTAYTGVIGIQGAKGDTGAKGEDSTSDIINIKGEGWNGETIKGNADEISSLGGDIDDLAGEGRTTETVKENADAIIQINSSISDLTNQVTNHKNIFISSDKPTGESEDGIYFIHEADSIKPDIPDDYIFDFDASKITGFSDGDELEVWENSVEDGIDVTYVSGKPKYYKTSLNDLPCVRFDSDNADFLQADVNLDLNEGITTFVVLNVNSFINNQAIFNLGVISADPTTARKYIIKYDSDGYFALLLNNIDEVSVVPSGSVPVVLGLKYTGSTIEIYKNGVLYQSEETLQTVTGINKLSIGTDLRTDRTDYLDADVQHIRTYQRALTNSELIAVSNMLLDKWGFNKKAEIIYGSIVYNPGNIPSGACEVQHGIYIDGVDFGDFVEVSASYPLYGLSATASVFKSGRISLALLNLTGSDVNLSRGVWFFKITKKPLIL